MTEEEKKLLEQQNAAKTNTGYESKWQDQVDNYINQIQNRKPFEYDLNADALYQQYANQYRQLGNMAMMDTMGQAQAMTGGYGNSYAQSVGQQAYNQQLNQLNNVVPELYSIALDRYMNDGNQLYNQLNIAMQQEDIDYGRYRDQLSDQRVAQDDAYNKMIALMTGYGYNPTADELSAAGITEAQKNAILAPYMAAKSNSRRSGSPGKPVVYGSGIDTNRNQSGLKGSAWDYTKNNLQQLVRSGNSDAIDNYMNQVSGSMSKEQFDEAIKIIEGKK